MAADAAEDCFLQEIRAEGPPGAITEQQEDIAGSQGLIDWKCRCVAAAQAKLARALSENAALTFPADQIGPGIAGTGAAGYGFHHSDADKCALGPTHQSGVQQLDPVRPGCGIRKLRRLRFAVKALKHREDPTGRLQSFAGSVAYSSVGDTFAADQESVFVNTASLLYTAGAVAFHPHGDLTSADFKDRPSGSFSLPWRKIRASASQLFVLSSAPCQILNQPSLN